MSDPTKASDRINPALADTGSSELKKRTGVVCSYRKRERILRNLIVRIDLMRFRAAPPLSCTQCLIKFIDVVNGRPRTIRTDEQTAARDNTACCKLYVLIFTSMARTRKQKKTRLAGVGGVAGLRRWAEFLSLPSYWLRSPRSINKTCVNHHGKLCLNCC